MTRADRLLIRNAIFLAAKTVKEAGRDQVSPRMSSPHSIVSVMMKACRTTGATGPSRWATAWRCSVQVSPDTF